MSKAKKAIKKAKKESSLEESNQPQVVKMKFSEDKYYNDLDKPIFEKDKVYELEGAGWIQRWVKRGGEVVEGEIPFPEQDEPNPSEIVGQGSEVANKPETSEDGEGKTDGLDGPSDEE